MSGLIWSGAMDGHGCGEPGSALQIDAPNSPMAQIGAKPLLPIAQLGDIGIKVCKDLPSSPS